MLKPLIFIAFVTPGLAMAKDSRNEQPPKPTQTTETCKAGKVWDKKTKSCKSAQSGALDDDTLYGAVRELAYAGQFENAQTVLSAMSDQSEPRVLTYWGFTHRKLGDVPTGMAFYRRAIKTDPGSILARSYMGQALVEQGDRAAALAELHAIDAHGGKDTWAYTSLQRAITTGTTYSY